MGGARHSVKHPWIICGTGPSFFDPGDHIGDATKIVTLNRALIGVRAAQFAFVAHRTALEAVAGHLHKARFVVVGNPFLADPGEAPFSRFPVLRRLRRAGKLITCGRRYDMPRDRPDLYNGLAHCDTVVNLALSYLVYIHGIRTVFTVGMDGGERNYAERFWDDYQNVPADHPLNYDKTLASFRELARRLKVEIKAFPRGASHE